MSSSKSAMKRIDECDVCGKMFRTVKAYNQHQRSFYLRGTGCFALQEQIRVNFIAAARPNTSEHVHGSSRVATGQTDARYREYELPLHI